MINFLIGVIVIFIIKYLYFRKVHEKKAKYTIKYLCVILISCIPLVLAINRLIDLKESDELYFGAHTLTIGIDSLIASSIYFTEYPVWIVPLIKFLMISFLAIGILSVIINKKYDGGLFLITTLILVLAIGLFLEHLLFEAKYPTERTALFYLPIISIFIYHLFQHLLKHYSIKKHQYIPVALCLIIPLCLNFLEGLNISYTRTWKYDAHTKDIMTIIKDKTQNINQRTSISNHWLFEPTINYYINIWKLNIDPANRNGINLNSDFIYRLDDHQPQEGFNVLNVYDDINSNLLIKIEDNTK